jgi:predicted phage terminase large subunit-like protein
VPAPSLAAQAVATATAHVLRQRVAPVLWQPEPHQQPPATDDWLYWLLIAGRGAGKNDALAHYVDQCARAEPIRIAIVAPTLGDAVDACVNGPSGLKAHNPAVRLVQRAGGTYVTWPNGAEGKLFGTHSPDDIDRLRAGGNRHLCWWDEIAACRYITPAFDNLRLGLRLGAWPRLVGSTTPRPRKEFRALLRLPQLVVTRATTDDNPHLDAATRAELYRQYGGTRLGRQELGGEVLEDVEGALWEAPWIEEARVRVGDVPALTRVVVAVDPAATATVASDRTGVVVAGLGGDGHYYVLASHGYVLSPHQWAARVIEAYHAHEADVIVAEVNNGGDMVVETLRRAWPEAPLKVIHSSRGKAVRAEPVALLYEQGRVHHAGLFASLEDQLTTFPVEHEHDDELDALVFALTELSAPDDRVRVQLLW